MKKAAIIIAILFAAGTIQAQQRSSSKSKAPIKGKNTHGYKSKRRSSRDEGHKFNFSYGVSLAMSNEKTDHYSDNGGTATLTRSAAAFGVFVYPKYSFYSTEKFSISVGIPLTLAFSGGASSNSRTGTESSASFLYDLPLMVDFNGGVMAPANRYGDSRFGYFVGVGIGMENTTAGYAYESNGYTGGYDENPKAKSVGPNVHAGVVFRIGSEDRPRFLGLRLSYKIGLNDDKFNYFTPSLFLNI